MKIAKSYNHKTGITYVYEVLENKWDKEKQRSVSKRRLIGKLDPVTGEIIPTRKRAAKNDAQEHASTSAAPVPEAELPDVPVDPIDRLKVDELIKQVSGLKNAVHSFDTQIDQILAALQKLVQ